MDTSTFVEIVSLSGILTVAGGVVQWWLNRGKQRVDEAQIMQGMAMNMLTPLNDQLKIALAEVGELRGQVQDLSDIVTLFLIWYKQVTAVMDEKQIEYPPLAEKAKNWRYTA